MVKNLPAMPETLVVSLGWEDLLKKEMATQSSMLAGEIPWTDNSAGYNPWVEKESDMDMTNTFTFQNCDAWHPLPSLLKSTPITRDRLPDQLPFHPQLS